MKIYTILKMNKIPATDRVSRGSFTHQLLAELYVTASPPQADSSAMFLPVQHMPVVQEMALHKQVLIAATSFPQIGSVASQSS